MILLNRLVCRRRRKVRGRSWRRLSRIVVREGFHWIKVQSLKIGSVSRVLELNHSSIIHKNHPGRAVCHRELGWRVLMALINQLSVSISRIETSCTTKVRWQNTRRQNAFTRKLLSKTWTDLRSETSQSLTPTLLGNLREPTKSIISHAMFWGEMIPWIMSTSPNWRGSRRSRWGSWIRSLMDRVGLVSNRYSWLLSKWVIINNSLNPKFKIWTKLSHIWVKILK